MSTRHLLDSEGAVVCTASSERTTTDPALASCEECLLEDYLRTCREFGEAQDQMLREGEDAYKVYLRARRARRDAGERWYHARMNRAGAQA